MPSKPKIASIAVPVTEKDSHALSKELNYFLRIDDSDVQLLARYRDVLAQGAAYFAEVYYDYLFSAPATAKALYRYEREGGDIGNLIRKQLRHLLSLVTDSSAAETASELLGIGADHHERGIDSACVLGAYRLYHSHLNRLIASTPEIPPADRIVLEEAVNKRLFRDVGLTFEGYWRNARTQATNGAIAALNETQAAAHLLANIPQMFWSIDVASQRLLYLSPATRHLCPRLDDCLIPGLDRTVAEDRELVQAAWERSLVGEQTTVECRMQLPGGQSRWFRRQFFPYSNAVGDVVRVDGFMEDITDVRHTLERLELLGTSDPLTGLANRTLWYDRLTRAIVAARRSGKEKLVLMLLDLNHFKMINDTLGHAAGDRILRQVAQRLQNVLRDSDTLARLGGDEFAVLLPGVTDADQAGEMVAKKVQECFIAPFIHNGEELYLDAAVGISIYPDHGEDADSLLSRADIAMYGAKRKDFSFSFYDPGSDVTAADQLQIAAGLRHALEREEYHLLYQPKIDMQQRRICGVEALLRWEHPLRGLILPERFIPIAEQSGQIAALTDWVLLTALRQCKQWRNAGLDLPVAVNVSASSFQNPRLVDRVRWALREADVPPECLEIEITENTLMVDLERGVEILDSLSRLGVAVAIDDFGTGYSSLSYLRQLPIHTLKIDKSFLSDVAQVGNDSVIVRSIIDLGHNLGYKVVAEGVETLVAWDLLADLGCDAVQGYHISHPLTHESLGHWLSESPWQGGMLN